MNKYTLGEGTQPTANNPSGLGSEAIGILADASDVGLLNWHIPTGEINMNPQVAALTGYEPYEIPHSGGSRNALIFEDDREKVDACINACMDGSQNGYQVEYRMRRKDGSIVWVFESAIVYERDKDGKATRLAAMVLDMTRLKWGGKKAHDMEKELARISNGVSKEGLANENRLLRAANSSAAMIIGGFYQDYETVLKQALQILGESLNADRAYMWRNRMVGDRLCCFQRSEWANENMSNHPSTEDIYLAYDDVVPDWRTLLQEESNIRALVRDLDPALIAFPGMQDVRSVMIIPLFLHGNFWGFLGFDDCKHEREFTEAEADIMRAGGLIIASSISRNETYGMLTDARDEAMASTRAKTEFLSRMSHEIRTPLNAIIGMSAIAQKSDDIEKMHYCLDKVDASSRQLLGIINDVLDMSKIDANKFEITQDEFDFEKMMQNIFNVVQVKLDEKHQEFHFDIDSAFSRKIISDELRLSQVLINLLNNAIKFTPNGGKVVLKVKEEPQGDISRLHVEVIDSGIGIAPEHQARLFSSFEQADNSITRQYGGTDLGLAICKKIVNLMNGDIWVESTPGIGSKFIFEVEVKWGGELPAAIKSNTIPKQLRILVADDSEDVLEYFRNILDGFSLLCDTVANGEEAIEAVCAKRDVGAPYDVIFLDWNMPGINGGQTAQEIRRVMDDNIVVVMISVADWSDIEKEAKKYKVSNFLAKPVLPSVLYNTIVELTQNTLVSNKEPEVTKTKDWRDKKLLLVEDIEINREIVLNVLEETEVNIDCAVNGMQAVQMLTESNETYDIVLMDVQMPIMDGLAATRQIRAMDTPYAKNVPIIAMTANAFKEDEKNCLAAGMNGHVAKPLEIGDLFSVLSKYLDK